MPLEHLSTALAEAETHPLSAKRMMLLALLIDAEADRLLPPGGDLLAHRAILAARSPALALVFALTALQPSGPRLVTEAVDVPLSDYPKLSEADFMVSLYNQHTVQRVRIALPDGTRHDALDVLREAAAALG